MGTGLRTSSGLPSPSSWTPHDFVKPSRHLIVGGAKRYPDYLRIIRLLCERSLMIEAISVFQDMKKYGLVPTLAIYNAITHGFARVKKFDDAIITMEKMVEARLSPKPEIYNGVIRAYGNHQIYDDMSKCIKRMESHGCFLDEVTYMFSCLEDLGNDISATVGRTNLVWCILLLCSACCFSHSGVESIIREMEVAEVQFTITFANILALFYLKMNDLRELHAIFLQARKKNLKPDIVTVGILFDAWKVGYNGTRVLEEWTTSAFLQEVAQMKTDKLVLTAFGKGFFLMSCEKLYGSLEPKAKRKKLWRYSDLIGLVFGELKATKLSDM